MKQKRIACPYCKEQILTDAKKCRFCGERLDNRTHPLGAMYLFWFLSMVIFLVSLYFVRRAPTSSANFWLASLGVIVLGGIVAYLVLMVNILGSIKTRKAKTYGLLTLVTFFAFFGLLFNYETAEAKLGFTPPVAQQQGVQVPVTSTPSASPAPTATTSKPKLAQKPVQQENQRDMWTVTSDGKTSLSRLPADKQMSTSDELWAALNAYRRAQNLPEFTRSDLLCTIAQNRANELQKNGKLDEHAGFSKYAHEQQTYNSMEEIIQGGVIPLSGTHLVEWGWDRSITGHRETLQSREMTDGCAAVSGLFAVGIFGAR